MHPKVKDYLDQVGKWQKELELLRLIMIECDLNEDFKWKHPCYTYQNKNIVIIQDFKDYCAILFVKGVLLKDHDEILVRLTDQVQSERQIRFNDISQIKALESKIKDYVREAIDVEKSGLKVKMKETSDYSVPEELKLEFQQNPQFKIAFEGLTPGRQRGYLLYFSQAKQSKTRQTRIADSKKRILIGKGLDDCVCGLSKRLPNCDGSHKLILLHPDPS
jgi:uncharacterized protein YdeI (YjbR/CyaY-like superfamily)